MYIIMTLFIVILLERFADQDDTKFEMEDLCDKVLLDDTCSPSAVDAVAATSCYVDTLTAPADRCTMR
jgi:hypothetical protein